MQGKKCVLICDDDQAILEACNIILSEKYNVEMVEHCDNIINVIERTRPDIILMDILMPGGGEDAVKKIHETKDIQHIPVVVFSALNEVEEISKRLNADAVLAKPFDINTLLETVEENIL